MAESKAEDILEQFTQLKDERQNWTNVWDEIIEFVFPRRTETDEAAVQGTRRDTSIFDGTAQEAHKDLSDKMQGQLVTPSYRWFGLRMEQDPLMEVPAIRKWLTQVETTMYAMLNRSNFYRQVNEYFMDASAFGTATMYSELDRRRARLQFTTRHPKEIFISQDQYGIVDKVYRRYDLTAKQWVEKFGRVHETISDMAETTPEQIYPCLHAVYPRVGRNPDKIDNVNMAVASCYIDIEHREIVRESGYRQMPYHVWRFYKNSDEVYGRSPAWSALSDIKVLNQMAKTQVMAAQLAVDPPLWIPEDYRDRIRFVPSGRNYYEGDPNMQRVIPIESGSKYGVSVDQIQRKQDQIRRHFMIHLFSAPDDTKTQKTAYEIQKIQEHQAIALGPTILGVEFEAFDPVIDRVFDIGMEEGFFPPPPAILLQRTGGKIKVDYLGPLALLQKRYFRNQPYQNTLQELGPIFQLRPETMDNFDWDEWTTNVAETNDVPVDTILSPQLVAQIREKRAEELRRAQQQQAMEAAGKAVPGLNQQVQSGSVLEQLGEQAG